MTGRGEAPGATFAGGLEPTPTSPHEPGGGTVTHQRYPEWRSDVPVRGYQLHSADWWDGHDAGYLRGFDVGQRTPDPAVVEELARQWLHEDAVRFTREVAAMLGNDEHRARREREAAGLAIARQRWETPRTDVGGDAA